MYSTTLKFSISVIGLPGVSSHFSYIYGRDINDSRCISWIQRASLSHPLLFINIISCDYKTTVTKMQPYLKKLNKKATTSPRNSIHPRLGVKQRHHSWWSYCTCMCKWLKCLLQTDTYWFPFRFSFLLLSMQQAYEKEGSSHGEVMHRAWEIIKLLPALK